MNNYLPPFNAVEWSVLGGAFLLFSVVPGLAMWMERLGQRRQAALARAAALRALVPEESTDAAVEGDVPVVAAHEGLAAVDTEPSASDVVAPSIQDPAAAPAVAEPVAIVEYTGPMHEFRLDDLRRARVLESPRGDVLSDPARQQEWEEGLKLAEAHAADIGATSLSAPFAPQARSFEDMRLRGEAKEIRFLLFTTLWPTSTDQAAGEAVFELGSSGVVRAYVVRR